MSNKSSGELGIPPKPVDGEGESGGNHDEHDHHTPITVNVKQTVGDSEATKHKSPKPYRDLYDILVLAFVILAFVAASWAVITTQEEVEVAKKALKEAKAATEITQRAWIAPGRIQFEPVPENAKHWIVGLSYTNTGQQPAFKVGYAIELFPVRKGNINKSSVLRAAISDNITESTCETLMPDGSGFVAFPNAERKLLKEIRPGETEQYQDGSHVIVVAGWFAYKTFDIVGRSCFCRFFDPSSDPNNHLRWRASVCQIREHAE